MRPPQQDGEDVGVTPLDEQQPSAWSMARRAPRSLLLAALRYGAPALAAIALVLVIGGDPSELDDDLHVSLPDAAPRTGPMPVRALIYTRLRQADGPVLARLPVEVEARTRTHRSLAKVQLQPAASDLEGMLELPALSTSDGPIEIHASVQRGDHALEARSTLAVAHDVGPAPGPRPLRGLQQFSAGPIAELVAHEAPSSLSVQVRGGACIPEQPCRLLVYVGEPAASIRVEPNSAVTPSAAARSGSALESGVVELEIVTHGPEAELWLSALHGATPVARRAVRLPIAMGAVGAAANLWLLDDSAALKVRGLDAEADCIVDLFREGHWVATGSLSKCAELRALPFALQPGLQRIQLRRDPFSAQTAGVLTLYVRQPGETSAQIAAALARAAVHFAPGDDVVQRCQRTPEDCSTEGFSTYLAALLDEGIEQPPPAISGFAASVARTRERARQMRSLALVALALGAAGLAFSIGRSGWLAGQRASDVSALDDPRTARRVRARSLVVVTASVASLVLVFVVLALYVLARAGT